MQCKVMIGRFPFGGIDHKDTTDWLIETIIKAKSDKRITDVFSKPYDDYPIPMVRNKCVKDAQERGVDYLCMIDNDMSPDNPWPGAKPFWDSSFDFLFNGKNPSVVCAPYCGPPPHSNVYVFRWASWQNPGVKDKDFRLEPYGREEAAQFAGIQEVAALPTGLILMDMRVFDILRPPYFYYEWKDKTECEKASTEDVTFSRDLCLQGVPIYCNWDAWCGHWKPFRVDRPNPVTVDNIRENYVAAIKRGQRSDEKLIDVKPTGLRGIEDIRNGERPANVLASE